MKRARPFPGSEARLLARVCLSGVIRRPALELGSQGMRSFFFFFFLHKKVEKGSYYLTEPVEETLANDKELSQENEAEADRQTRSLFAQ